MKLVKAINGKHTTVFEKKDYDRLYRIYVKEKTSLTETAIRMNVKSNVIQRILNEKDWMRKKKYDFTEKQKQQIENLYINKNLGYHTIAKKLGTPLEKTRKYIRDEGLTRSEREKSKIRGDLSRKETIKKFINLQCTSYPEYRYAAYRLLSCLWPVISHVVDPEAKRILYSDFTVDHILSVYDAYHKYDKPVCLKILTHPSNLQIITKSQNSSKNTKSHIKLSELKKRIKMFNQTEGAITWLK